MKNKFLIVLFLVLGLKINAQEFKLGKVSIKELEEKKYLKDTTAVAAVLYNAARTFFAYNSTDGFSINTENSFRIKIYKKEGLKWATYKKAYRIGYEHLNNDLLEFSDCVTYNLEGGKMVKTKLNSEGIFKIKINEFWDEVAITLPNVKVGSIVEFKYVLKSQNIVEFPNFNFQQEIPVKSSVYVTQIPGFFVYKAIAKKSSELKFDSKIEGGSIIFPDKYDPVRSETVNFQQAKNTYSVQDLPALKEEPFIDNIENYRVSIFHELEKTQFYQEPAKDYSNSWEGVAKMIYSEKGFGKELKEREFVGQDLTRILKNVESKDERLNIIFKFVQNKMNWNNKRGYCVDKGVKQAYIDRTGNTAEINFILMAMLNYAGIKASPVLLSTVDNGIPIFPNRTIFNYVIVAAEVEGKRVLLDASNKFTTRNILPTYALNWTGRLINEDGSSEEIKLEPDFLSKKTTNMLVDIDGFGKLSGKYRVNRYDYEALIFRENFTDVNKQNYLEKIENEFPGVQISDYTIENSKDLALPVVQSFGFTADNQAEIIGDKMYIYPKLFFTQIKNPFVQEKRDNPIYFGFPTNTRFEINIKIPQGYVVESMPKPVKLQTVGNVESFIMNCASSADSIQITIVSAVNKQLVSADFYPILKDFYQQMIDKQNEKIVLKKI